MKKTATRKTEPNEGLSHASQLVILHTRPSTTHHHSWTVATDPTKRRSNSRRGSNHDDGVSRRICLEHPGMFFFFSYKSY